MNLDEGYWPPRQVQWFINGHKEEGRRVHQVADNDDYQVQQMLSIYAAYEEGDDGFQEKYFAMLKAGGSKHHKELLAPFGLDASDPAFWDKGLGMIEGLIDQLEAMEE